MASGSRRLTPGSKAFEPPVANASARSARSAHSALSGRNGAPAAALPAHLLDLTTPAGLASLQRFAGNTAVEHLLRGRPHPADVAGPPVQRCGAEPCGCSDDGRAAAALAVQRQSAGPTQAEEAAFARKNPGMVTSVGDTSGGGGGLGQTDPNEFVLWNYLVGRADLRSGHVAEIAPVAARWRPLLAGNPSLRVKVVGSASTSGGAAVNTSLAVRRAQALKAFLVARGIPAKAIDAVAVGITQPLADDRTAAGMARNRRVELYLIRPTTVVDTLTSASADVVSESVSIGSTFTRTVDPAGFVAIRHSSMRASAVVEGFGSPGSEVGYLQFVRHDERIGRYRPAAGSGLLTLDFSRCTKPYLPCKDVAESMAAFSSQPLALRPGPLKTRGKVSVDDNPGVAFPIDVTDPRPARLDELKWSMEFVCVLGVRSDDQFMALQHFIWRVDVTHSDAAGPAPKTTEVATLVAGGVPGAPPSLDIAGAMSLQTCRFTMRRIEATGGGPGREMCQPELL